MATTSNIASRRSSHHHSSSEIHGVCQWDEVVVVDALPHTATGKINKLALRRQFRDYKLASAAE